jgi:V8-like Glu-specific endopeptidase
MPPVLQKADLGRIAAILTDQAATAPAGVGAYYRDLITRAELPPAFRMQLGDLGAGDPRATSLRLIWWADAKDVNPCDPRYTTLGSIVRVVLDDVGLEAANTLVAVIVAYELYRDPALLAALTARFQVPVAGATLDAPEERSPEIDWRGSEDSVELQLFRQPPPDLIDVGFLSRAIHRSSSVCRIERSEGVGLGTGFLVAGDLVLTNYHVLAPEAADDPRATAADLSLRFGCVTAPEGKEADGQVFRLHAEEPLVQASPVAELDYALLRVEPKIRTAADLGPIERPTNAVLAKGMALNILQHPRGGPMKLALSSNGITGVYDDIHRVQYVTIAAGGSSGSPCFDDDWQLVALHHAERSKAFGTVRQGIPIAAIYEQISTHF